MDLPANLRNAWHGECWDKFLGSGLNANTKDFCPHRRLDCFCCAEGRAEVKRLRLLLTSAATYMKVNGSVEAGRYYQTLIEGGE